jgi:very-short-patch-repair endonuclease
MSDEIDHIKELNEYIEKQPNHFGRYVERSRPELYTLIKDQPGKTNTEKAYNFLHPGEYEAHKSCKVCGKELSKFISIKLGYRIYCSNKCSTNDPDIQEKMLSGFKRSDFQEKRKATLIARYGTDSMVTLNRASGVIQAACIKKYGVDNALKHSSMQRLREEAYMARHGVDNPYKDPNVKNKIKDVLFDRYGVERALDLVDWSKIDRSRPEIEIASIIENYGFTAIYNDRTIIPPYELDIYIPALKLAIEYNGIYWHSERAGKSKSYHLNKTKMCEAKGIKLLHIFEDEWSNKKELIIERLRVQLQKADRIYARKCQVVELSNDEAMIFSLKHHIQGHVNASIRYGLIFNDKLVALMTFGKSRFSKKFDWELLRYCSLSGLTVVGGASKLLAHFKKHQTGSIVSYADRRWSTGNLYRQLGFELQAESQPNYFYVRSNEMKRITRMAAQKHLLPDLLGELFDPLLSEVQNMKNAGYDIIYDCGSLVYGLKA